MQFGEKDGFHIAANNAVNMEKKAYFLFVF
jgi:hypothetical protein